MQWAIFSRVIDNFGDVGVAWRLAAELAARGETVSLWLDDRRALAWMAPHGAAGVTVGSWAEAAAPDAASTPADVVVETFGCGLPATVADRMAARTRPPLWINLEHLSAEPYVDRSHGLASPRQHGPGAGLTQWYFYPGFSPTSGGLLRETDLQERQRRFARAAWLQSLALPECEGNRPGTRIVTLFCYENAQLSQLLDMLAGDPTLLLVAPGVPARQVLELLGPRLERGALRASLLPALSQRDFDHLLWSADLNFVRGEDSFVRAQWVAAPFVWQAYPQDDGVHLRKLEAFLSRLLASATPDLAADVRRLHLAWNGAGPWPRSLPASGPWAALCTTWREGLLALPDLCTRLQGFVDERR